MEVLVMLMALILIPMLFVMAVRFNRYLVILLPLVLLALFVIWKYDLLVRLPDRCSVSGGGMADTYDH